MKSRLRQLLRSPLRSPAMHLAECAAGCALRTLFFGGGKGPVLAGSDPPLRGSLPANFAALVHARAQHDFMQVLPPRLRRFPGSLFSAARNVGQYKCVPYSPRQILGSLRRTTDWFGCTGCQGSLEVGAVNLREGWFPKPTSPWELIAMSSAVSQFRS